MLRRVRPRGSPRASRRPRQSRLSLTIMGLCAVLWMLARVRFILRVQTGLQVCARARLRSVGAWPFGGRLVALGFALGFSAALPFPHACNSIFVCIELIEEKESHVATPVYPSHHVRMPRQHLTVRTNRLINEWFVLFVWSSCNFFATSKGSN